ISQCVDRIELSAEAFHDRRLERRPESSDVHLSEMKACHWCLGVRLTKRYACARLQATRALRLLNSCSSSSFCVRVVSLRPYFAIRSEVAVSRILTPYASQSLTDRALADSAA